ncbi:hypothetical protein J6590_093278, partial [Homalodisca vitripennis]
QVCQRRIGFQPTPDAINCPVERHFSMKLNVLAGYDLGASCDYDEDCIADHSYCRNQQVCQCRIGFQPSPDGITCLASK